MERSPFHRVIRASSSVAMATALEEKYLPVASTLAVKSFEPFFRIVKGAIFFQKGTFL